jgi:hypothetical protein
VLLGDTLGDALGDVLGDALGDVLGDLLGEADGAADGDAVGCRESASYEVMVGSGALLGAGVGALNDVVSNVGDLVGAGVGDTDGASLGDVVGAIVNTLLKPTHSHSGSTLRQTLVDAQSESMLHSPSPSSRSGCAYLPSAQATQTPA